MTNMICHKDLRREEVRRNRRLNGLDYLELGSCQKVESNLEVGSGQVTLSVYFLGKAPVELDKSNVIIEGGRRIGNIRVEGVDVRRNETVELDDCMEVVVDKPGDFSTYTLRVVERDAQGNWQPHSAFDPRYDRVNFSFMADCPSELDCKPSAICPPEAKQEPEINYLAKDYESFRQLILDRLALVMPDWKERHVPDIGIALVEVLAHVGDHLSYYQDAVATEAYLDTARKRISVRRHARLVDYPLHEGCNARAWVCVDTKSDLPPLDSKDLYFITGSNDILQVAGNVLSEDDLRQIPSNLYEVFEPMTDQEIQLYQDHSELHFYTWGDKECCLPRGTTRATLIGELIKDEKPEKPCGKPDNKPEQDVAQSDQSAAQQDVEQSEQATSQQGADKEGTPPKLRLKPNDVLIFEEVIGPETGHPGDADPKHRHAVRLTAVEAGIDRLNGKSVVEITWAEEDALPFPLCLSALEPAPDCKLLENISVARGNVILVDHGRTKEEDLGSVPVKETVACCRGEGALADEKILPVYYRPSLRYDPLTFSQPLTPDAPASKVPVQDVRLALPQISIDGKPAPTGEMAWVPRSDLLASGPDDQHFVAEMDNDGRAHLRFGDDTSGEQPDAGTAFHARYRVGNGPAGNVGAEAISHMVLRKTRLRMNSLDVRNPMPAQGGTAPEPLAEARLYAPHMFRKTLQRAITAADYAEIVEREFKDKVQRAVAKLRWTGSWYEVLVAIDPFGKEEADSKLLDAITGRLHRYRRMGHDLVVRSAHRVPLDIEMMVCVLPNYLRGHIKAELMDIFSNRILPDGRKGFFHPDNLSFGEGIYLSKLVATAQAVEGVESVGMTTLKRLNEPVESSNRAIENGKLPLGPFEIARLDSDPSFPENGKLTLYMRGGR